MREDSIEFWRLAQLWNVLNMRDPVDREIYNHVKSKKLAFGFVKTGGMKE